MSNTLTKVQEVYFDVCDLLNSGEANNFNVSFLYEFETLKEFLLEQKRKLEEIEEDLKTVTLTGDECANLLDALQEWAEAVGPKEVDPDETGLDYDRYHALVNKLKGE